MSARVFLLVTLLVISITTLAASLTWSFGPKDVLSLVGINDRALQFDSTVVELGHVDDGQLFATAEFKCANRGTDEVTILKAQADCSCTKVELPDKLNAGESTLARVKIKVPGREGRQELHVVFRWQDRSGTHHTLLKVYGDFPKAKSILVSSPRRIDLGELQAGSAIEREIPIALSKEIGDRSQLQAVSKLEWLKLNLSEGEDGQSTLRMFGQVPSRLGAFKTKIDLSFRHNAVSTDEIELGGRIVGSCEVTPRYLLRSIDADKDVDIAHVQVLDKLGRRVVDLEWRIEGTSKEALKVVQHPSDSPSVGILEIRSRYAPDLAMPMRGRIHLTATFEDAQGGRQTEGFVVPYRYASAAEQ